MRQIPSISPDPTRETQAGAGTVRLAGVDVPIIGDVHVQDLARFQSKTTFGDYSHDSDPLLSTTIMSSFTGGIGNEQLKEGVDDETYWTGTAETRYPGQITLPAYTWVFPSPLAGTATATPLADFPAAAPSFWAAFDTQLARFNEIERAFTIVGQLPGLPANKAVEYDGRLYVPLGLSGYAVVAPDGGITAKTDLDVVAFCLWDNKLAALTVAGALRLKYLATDWEAALPALSVPSAAVPRNLVVYVNQQGQPTLHVVTNTDVWAYDRENELLYRTQLQFPRHPDQGLGSCNWRGESLYVSVGLGIHAYNGGIVSAMGPDGRYGLPAGLRGTITDLEPEYNALIAVVQGELVADDTVQKAELTRRQYEDPPRLFRSRDALSCLLRWTSFGWHPVWQAPTPAGRPTRALVSSADNRYRLWWGYGGSMYYQTLPRSFHNPKAGMQVGTAEFAKSASLTTGWFDADMPAFTKLGAHGELVLEDVFGDGTPTGTVAVSYQIDSEPGWRFWGEAKRPGRTVFPLGIGRDPDDQGRAAGLPFRRIRFRLDFERGDAIGLSPVLVSFQLKYQKLPLSQLSFRFTVDLSQDRDFMGAGPGKLTDFIRSLASSDAYHELVHRDRAYRVTVAQTAGNETTGYDRRGGLVVNAVEVRLPPHEWLPLPGEDG